MIQRLNENYTCKGDVARTDFFRLLLVLLLACSILACLPAFHASAGINAIDAFDQGISSPAQKSILGAMVAHSAPPLLLLRGLNPGPISRMRT
ncbi:MAG: hypothetical protein Q8K89_09240 [Actinomycetota bacterium]|nr:hypothetical protein [Actinomycetota bacterium]